MTPLFDVEFLQKLTYERSKTWSFVLDKLVAGDELCAMNVKDLGEAYGSEDDENDSSNELASMEECEDDEILDAEFLRNITNTARLSVMMNNKTVLPDSSFTEKQNELMDIFNQTLPIINEHNRQLQEFGLDKILISFDKEKIEEKVGGWLNRHNSLYGGNKTLLGLGKCKNDEIEENARYAFEKSPVCKKMCNDSDDSLQSGETARYIRSSKANGNKKSATTSTMIKTYRMIRSTREATRQKYNCEMVDDKTIRHRRTIDNDNQHRQNNCNLMQFHKNHKHYITPSPLRQRRKVFRKRIFSNSFSTTDSSSDTDYCYEDYHSSKCKNLKFTENRCSSIKYGNYLAPKDTTCSIKRSKCHRRSAMKMPSAQSNRMYYFSHSQSKSVCCVTRKRLTIKRDASCSIDELPCRDELECHCCDAGKLCSNFKHIANSSTEKWYVENCCSPKKIRRLSTDNTSEESFTTTKTTQKVLKTKNQKAKSKANSKMETAKKATVKSKPETSKSQNNLRHQSSNGFESSDYELQLALEASKECYEKEQHLKKNSKKQSKEEILKSKPLRKILKPESEIPNDVANDAVESIGKLPVQIENVRFVEVEPAKLHLTSSNITEETFFTPTKAICNSTAVSRKSQAYKRQILTKSFVDEKDKSANKLQNKTETDLKKSLTKSDKAENSKTKKSKNNKVKSSTTIAKDGEQIEKFAASTKVSSTTKRSLEITAKVDATPSETKEPEQEISISSCDSDCTLVTSTTNIVQPPKGILVYAPENRDMLPEGSATNNGFFTITKEYLSTVIGEKQAEKLLKSYVGRKRFRLDSTVYYRPTEGVIGKDSSSDSDALDYARQYGDFHEETK